MEQSSAIVTVYANIETDTHGQVNTYVFDASAEYGQNKKASQLLE